jgi:predicted PurR-regulated permease PerM
MTPDRDPATEVVRRGVAEEPSRESARVRKVFLLVLVSGVTLLFAWMIREYILALLIAALIAAELHPIYRKFARRLGGRKELAAGMLVALLTLLGVAPLVGLGTLAGVQAVALVRVAEPWARDLAKGGPFLQQLVDRFPSLAVLERYQGPITQKLGELGSQLGTAIVAWGSTAASQTMTFFLLVFVMLYATFFFLVGGREALQKVLYYSPLPPDDEERIVSRFLSVARATVKGTLVVGVAQGALGGLGFWVAGIGGAVFWSVLMTLLSVIPSVGTAIVWVPGVVYLFAAGKTAAAVGLLAWCMLIVASIDNLLRPVLVGRDTKLPDVMILISTLGGIVLFGITGFVIGPLIASMFVTVWEIYGEAFRDVLPEPEPLSTTGPMPPVAPVRADTSEKSPDPDD